MQNILIDQISIYCSYIQEKSTRKTTSHLRESKSNSLVTEGKEEN